MFMWRCLGIVDNQRAIFSEVADYVVLSNGFSAAGSVFVVPLMIWVVRSRRLVSAIALAVVSALVYAAVHYVAFGIYAIRIT